VTSQNLDWQNINAHVSHHVTSYVTYPAERHCTGMRAVKEDMLLMDITVSTQIT